MLRPNGIRVQSLLSKNNMNIKAMRNAHLYLGCFFAPLLVLFLLTGTWQMFDMHKDSKKTGGYKAPAVIKALSRVHTDQQLTDQKPPSRFTDVFRYLLVLMSIGLLVTTILGIVMAFKYTRPSFVWACLLAGIVIPILLLFISKACADDSEIIKADRQALAEANATGVFSKILAAKEQLSDDLGAEADQRRKEADLKLKEAQGFTIPLIPDGQGHFLADVLINNRVHASLVVDTGSPVVMLTADFVRKLDLDISQSHVGYVEVLNGKYKAAAVSLDNVRVGNAKASDIGATVLLEGNKEIRDGLLGMSFLSRFHFTLDEKGQKLILRKAE